MQTKLIFVVGCMFFLIASSSAMAVESDTVPGSAKESVAAIHVDKAGEINKDPNLQKWLNGIKPAAGVNYWEQKVVRRSSHTTRNKGQE